MNKNNNDILNELFFNKKKSYSEKKYEQQAQYTPVKNTADIKSLFNGKSQDGFIVSDTDEVKKRIFSALGMAVGNNTVKSMANKAIKSFPIIVSDDIAPETLVIVKTMMEEQYASYIDLLVSNQIINLSDFSTDGSSGNIAIQALNKLDGTDFSTGRLARQAQTGSLTLDDVMKNNPGWQFLRTNENLEYKSGNAILDTLMENALIVPSEYANVTACKLEEEMINMQMANLNEASFAPWFAVIGAHSASEITDPLVISSVSSAGNTITQNDITVGQELYDITYRKTYKRNAQGAWDLVSTEPEKKEEDTAVKRLNDVISNLKVNERILDYKNYGINKVKTDNGYETEYSKLLTPSVLVNQDNLDNILDRSVANILSKSDKTGMSDFIRDRFEKASFLLTARKISGGEFIDYVTDRLGLPISDRVRQQLVTRYTISNVRFDGIAATDIPAIKILQGNISRNSKFVLTNVVQPIVRLSVKDIVTIGAASGAGIASGVAAGLGLLAFPVGLIAVGAAAVGGGAIAIAKYVKRKKELTRNRSNIETSNPSIYGWERVEYLIEKMDSNMSDLKNHKLGSNLSDYTKQENIEFNKFANKMKDVLKANISLKEEITYIDPYVVKMQESQINECFNTIKELDEEIKSDEKLYEEFVRLDESYKYKIISTSKPSDIIVKQTKYNPKDIAGVVPVYGTRDTVAYGSVEYDRRDMKDRKFNEPLILTIKFRERYSDDKYADNELTAVIGILGVVTRVPSAEMTEILKSNAEGKTLKDFFKSDGNAKDLISNLIADFSKSKYAEKLPTSGKVWANLEKITALAVANKLSGNNNGNISNAHLVFSQREIDQVKNETGVDYLKNAKLTAQLMKKYSAFMIAVCNDVMQYLYTFSDPDAISWDDAPYSAYMGKSNSDQLLSAFTQYNRMKL